MTQTVHTFFNLGKMKFYMGSLDMGTGLAKDRVEIEQPNDDTLTEDGGTGSSCTMIQSNRNRQEFTVHYLPNSPTLLAIIKLVNQGKYGHFQGVLDHGNGSKFVLNNMIIKHAPKLNMLQYTDEVNSVDVVLTMQSVDMDSLQAFIDLGLETGVEVVTSILNRLN